jgi:predicted small metal-binding protein
MTAFISNHLNYILTRYDGVLYMKMRIVRCSDVGIDCNFMAHGYDLDEVEMTMWNHIETEHKDMLKSMSEDDHHQLKHRVGTFLGRSCGCGHLEKPGETYDKNACNALHRIHTSHKS